MFIKLSALTFLSNIQKVMKMGTIEDLTKDGRSPPPIEQGSPGHRINVVIISNGTELGGDEGVGRVAYNGNRRQGTFECLANLCRSDNAFSRAVNIVGFIDEKPYVSEPDTGYVRGKNAEGYTEGGLWHPSTELVTRDDNGNVISAQYAYDCVAEIPSNWRYIGNTKTRKIDGVNVYLDEERLEQKLIWEQEVARETDRLGGDVLLSDSCMTIFGYGIPQGTGLLPIAEDYGVILNIHPGVTQGDYTNKGNTPTANIREGIERGDNPNHLGMGATLHYVARNVDEGRVICSASVIFTPEIGGEFLNIPQKDGDQRNHMIREYVYPIKNGVAEEGIQTYLLENRERIMDFRKAGGWSQVYSNERSLKTMSD